MANCNLLVLLSHGRSITSVRTFTEDTGNESHAPMPIHINPQACLLNSLAKTLLNIFSNSSDSRKMPDEWKSEL